MDFAKFDEISGGIGFKITNPTKLKLALKEAFTADTPSILDVVTNPVRF